MDQPQPRRPDTGTRRICHQTSVDLTCSVCLMDAWSDWDLGNLEFRSRHLSAPQAIAEQFLHVAGHIVLLLGPLPSGSNVAIRGFMLSLQRCLGRWYMSTRHLHECQDQSFSSKTLHCNKMINAFHFTQTEFPTLRLMPLAWLKHYCLCPHGHIWALQNFGTCVLVTLTTRIRWLFTFL